MSIVEQRITSERAFQRAFPRIQVANVCRADVIEFLVLAAEIPIRPVVREFPLSEANRALWKLKTGNIQGAKVLHIG